MQGKGGEDITVDRKKVDLILAEKRITITDVCKLGGFSRTRFYTVMNSKKITPKTAGRFAEVLGVDVTEIIEVED